MKEQGARTDYLKYLPLCHGKDTYGADSTDGGVWMVL